MKRIKSYQSGAVCYLVATPIGNMKDISQRALETLSAADLIACEDTRTTGILLKKYNIQAKTVSYHEHNEQECSARLLKELHAGNSVAVVSDAGYPGISDPGSILVQHCIEEGIPVSVIPGGNAFLPALIGSGLDTRHFYFHGFLSARQGERRKELQSLRSYPVTLIFYEAPHRIMKTLQDLYDCFGARKAALCREISKLHEEYIYGTLDELKTLDEATLRGEMVLLVSGNTENRPMKNEETCLEDVRALLSQGISLKDACRIVAEETGVKKHALYQKILEEQNPQG